MDSLFINYLYTKRILVNERIKDEKTAAEENGISAEEQFALLFSLANLFGIKIVQGAELINHEILKVVDKYEFVNVPEPFYKGFPESVKKLTEDELLYDQLLHYYITYGLGNFSSDGHSVFEKDFERIAFKEDVPVLEFSIVTEKRAEELLKEYAYNMLQGTRPIELYRMMVLERIILDYDLKVERIASKNNAVYLLNDTRDMRFAVSLSLSDVLKLVDTIIYYGSYHDKDINKLNLKNKDRKFITSLIHRLFENGKVDTINCYEKQKTWCGLLHHIHFAPETPEEKEFVDAMRSGTNRSVYSGFEKAMTEKDIRKAVQVLREGKGVSVILRNLNYLISRCETPEDVRFVIENIKSDNVIILIQLLINYSQYKKNTSSRTFTFIKHGKQVVHKETIEELIARKSDITFGQANMLCEGIKANLENVLKNRLGKVYIEPEMKNYALPIQEGASQGGAGVLPRGTHIHIGETKKLRAFTYWEKVDDIDLSVFGLDEYNKLREFSWRTMAHSQSEAITYSGDKTDGYNGGSEYFDIVFDDFRKKYPDTRYLIFCDNVFSGGTFNDAFCKAGYMLRDIEDSGEIYEPKTVKSSFRINSDSSFAYLFGVDLEKNDFVWLNAARDSLGRVAGSENMDYLIKYFSVIDIINMYSFFEMLATEVVDNPADADVIVTNRKFEAAEGQEVIREYDFEKMISLM